MSYDQSFVVKLIIKDLLRLHLSLVSEVYVGRIYIWHMLPTGLAPILQEHTPGRCIPSWNMLKGHAFGWVNGGLWHLPHSSHVICICYCMLLYIGNGYPLSIL